MIDAAGESELPFQVVRDVGFDLLRRHAGIEGGDRDHRQIDGWKHVYGHIRSADGAKDHHHQTEHNDEVWIANGKAGHSAFLAVRGVLVTRGLRLNLFTVRKACVTAHNDGVTPLQTGQNFHSIG